MKKNHFIFLLASILIILTSCKNFMLDSTFKDELENIIDYTNKPFIKIKIISDVQATKEISPSAGEYYNTYKNGDFINLSFEPSDNYKFIKWEISNEQQNFVTIENPTEQITKAKIINTTDQIITIQPVCELKLKIIQYSPDNAEKIIPQDSNISITLNKPINPKDVNFNNINITSNGLNLNEYFQNPVLSNNNQTITIKVKKHLLTSEELNKIVIINVSFSNIHEITESISNIHTVEKTFSYIINNETDKYPPEKLIVELYKDSEYKEKLSSGPYTSWSNEEIITKTNRTNKIYFKIWGYDNNGLSAIKITEKTVLSLVEFGDYILPNESNGIIYSNTIYKDFYSNENNMYYTEGDYTFCTTDNGIIRLFFNIIDTSDNESIEQIQYDCVYDSLLKPKNISAKEENHSVNVNNNIIENEFIRMSDSENETLEISIINDYIIKRDSDDESIYSDYKIIKIYSGNDINNLQPVLLKNNKFKINRNIYENTYMRYYVEDFAGNTLQFDRIIPKTVNIYRYEENSSDKSILLYPEINELNNTNDLIESGYYFVYQNLNNKDLFYVNNRNSYTSPFSGTFKYSSLSAGDYNIYVIPYTKYEEREYFGTASKPFKITVTEGNPKSYVITGKTTIENINNFNQLDKIQYESNGANSNSVHVKINNFENTTGYNYIFEISNASKMYNFKEEIDVMSNNLYKLYIIYYDDSGNSNKKYLKDLDFRNIDNNQPVFNLETTYSQCNYSLPGTYRLFNGFPYCKFPKDNLTDNETGMFENENGKNEIEYWIVKFDKRQSSIKKYTEEELKNITSYKIECDFNQTGKQNPISIPYGHLDNGKYTLCMKVKDKADNYTYAYDLLSLSSLSLEYYLNFKIEDSHKVLIATNDKSNNNIFRTIGTTFFDYYYDDLSNIGWILNVNDSDQTEATGSPKSNPTNQQKPYIVLDNILNCFHRIDCTDASLQHLITQYRYPAYEFSESKVCEYHAIELISHNIIKVYADNAVFIHLLHCQKNLSELAENEKEECEIWGSRAIEVPSSCFQKTDISEFTCLTYNTSISEVPEDSYYTIMVHFADGSSLMTKPLKK